MLTEVAKQSLAMIAIIYRQQRATNILDAIKDRKANR